MFGFQNKKHLRTSWHPDFRIVELLPDIKVVRTKFIVNVISIVVVSMLLVLNGYREIVKFSVRSKINNFQEEIQRSQPSNQKLTMMSMEFTKLGAELKDIKTFKEKPFDLIETIMQLSKMCGSNVIYDKISYLNSWDSAEKKEVHSIRLNGKGRTTADIGELKNKLSALKVAEGYTIQVSEVGNPTKDPNTGVFSFGILVKVSEGKNGSK